jgi:hypothetical protein
MGDENVRTEEYQPTGHHLVAKVKELKYKRPIREGN